jgi:hypothetical protein
MRLATLNQALGAISGLREGLRDGKFDSARRELHGLRRDMLELRESGLAASPQTITDFQQHLTGLSILEDAVDDQLDKIGKPWDTGNVRDTLRGITDFLQTLEVQARLQNGA